MKLLYKLAYNIILSKKKKKLAYNIRTLHFIYIYIFFCISPSWLLACFRCLCNPLGVQFLPRAIRDFLDKLQKKCIARLWLLWQCYFPCNWDSWDWLINLRFIFVFPKWNIFLRFCACTFATWFYSYNMTFVGFHFDSTVRKEVRDKD